MYLYYDHASLNRTKGSSVFRCDRVTPNEVLNGHPNDGLAEIAVQEIRDAGCIIVVDESPRGHLVAYRGDDARKRISTTSATKVARVARWLKLPTKP